MPQPRKPTNVLHLSGAFKKNPQRLKARANEPVFVAGMSECPDWIDLDAQNEWSRIVPDLEAAGVTTRIEATALAMYCQAYSHAKKAQAEIFRDGLTIMTESGLKKHPAVGIYKDSMALARAYLTEFGMTPASRSKVSAKPQEKEVNEYAAV